jgi:mRNA-degrading endonuclease toxin of MazEF toxin-antitoxin module
MSKKHPTFNQERSFKRGEVYMVDFSKEPRKFGEFSRTIEGPHRAVVLFDSDFPRKTVVVVPISSLHKKDGTPKETISTDVILDPSEYTGHTGDDSIHNDTVKADCVIKTDQITTISRNYLERKKGQLLPKDILKVDIQLISVLSLQDIIEQMVAEEVASRLADLGIEVESTDEN